MKTKTSLMGNSFNEPAVAIQQNETETSYRSTSDIIRICLIAGITSCLTVAPATKAAPIISAAPNPVVYVAKPTTLFPLDENVITLTTFISGLVIWNVVALLGAWLLALPHNKIKQ
jgi:hypothetical protein